MFPPVFALAAATPAVTAVFGTSPVRVYPFGEAPQSGTKPYAVWQSITILPENYIGTAPDVDSMSTQIDVYAMTATAARSGAQVLRDLYQLHGYVIAMREWPKEAETGLYRYQLDVDFWQYR